MTDTCTFTSETEINILKEDIEKLLEENKQLKEDKKKAIEYIKDYIEYYGLHIQNDEMEKSYYKRLEELLEILGGKNENIIDNFCNYNFNY